MPPEATDAELRERGARDWAHSIQARFAELLSGGIAREGRNPATMVPTEHRDRILSVLTEVGADPELINNYFAAPPLEKVSEYDEPYTRRLIQNVADDVSDAMEAMGLTEQAKQLMMSSLPSGSVNAFCCANTWDDTYHHVFVDSDLPIFCNSVSKIVASCLSRGLAKGAKIDLRSSKIIQNARSPDLGERAVDLYVHSVMFSLAGGSRVWLPDPEAVPTQMFLTQAMERFVVAHEMSHLVLGHLDTDAETVEVNSAQLQDTEAVIFSHQAELQADALGAIVVIRMENERKAQNILTPMGPYIFMKAIELLEACHAKFDRNAGGIESTHPDAAVRGKNIEQLLLGVAGDELTKRAMKLLLQRLDQIFYWLGRPVLRALDEMREQGLKPRERERFRLFEASSPPAILGVRSTSEQLQLDRDHLTSMYLPGSITFETVS